MTLAIAQLIIAMCQEWNMGSQKMEADVSCLEAVSWSDPLTSKDVTRAKEKFNECESKNRDPYGGYKSESLRKRWKK